MTFLRLSWYKLSIHKHNTIAVFHFLFNTIFQFKMIQHCFLKDLQTFFILNYLFVDSFELYDVNIKANTYVSTLKMFQRILHP